MRRIMDAVRAQDEHNNNFISICLEVCDEKDDEILRLREQIEDLEETIETLRRAMQPAG